MTYWGEATGDPVEDVRRFVDEVLANPSPGPCRIVISPRAYERIARRYMTKRRFRRWRGRRRAVARLAARAAMS